MKMPSTKTRLMIVASLLIIASLDASLYAQRPRRGVDKRYTSPEEIQRRQDSLSNQNSDSLEFSDAISDMRSVVTRSDISSSPSWRFPMNRMMRIRKP